MSASQVESIELRASENASRDSTAAQEVRPQWNTPRIHTLQIMLACLFCFNHGMNDASFGAVLPYVGTFYHLNYLVVSLIFVSPLLGFSAAALANYHLHATIGQRGIAFLGPALRLVANLTLSQHPPYPVIIVMLPLNGFGIGLVSAAWNAYMASFTTAHQILGILHACYGLGGTLSPIIATTLAIKTGGEWWLFYYIQLGLVIGETVLGPIVFRHASGKSFRENAVPSSSVEAGTSVTRATLSNKVVWLLSAFLFFSVGAEICLGGWLVTFMEQIRSLDPYHSGFVVTGFWAGLTLGRLALGFVTPKLGERIALSGYLVASIGLELLFWLVPNAVVSAVAAALIGFFIGPLFPAGVAAAMKLLPRSLHVQSLGFACAIGAGGVSLLPFAVGALAQARGVQALEPVVLSLLLVDLVIWLALSRLPKHQHSE